MTKHIKPGISKAAGSSQGSAQYNLKFTITTTFKQILRETRKRILTSLLLKRDFSC